MNLKIFLRDRFILKVQGISIELIHTGYCNLESLKRLERNLVCQSLETPALIQIVLVKMAAVEKHPNSIFFNVYKTINSLDLLTFTATCESKRIENKY